MNMAEINYDTLKKDFHEWLKVQAQQANSLLDAEKIDQISLQNITVTYNKEFKEFLATRKDVGEENFVKSAINIEEENLNFLDEMFDDFVSGLSKEDSVYKAIDTDSNKTISDSEKNIFFQKIKGLDGNAENISLSDFSTAIENTIKGDLSFLAAQTTETIDTPSTGGSGGGGGGGGGGGSDDITQPTTTSPYPYEITPIDQMKGLYEISLNPDNYDNTIAELSKVCSNHNYASVKFPEIKKKYLESKTKYDENLKKLESYSSEEIDAIKASITENDNYIAKHKETIDTETKNLDNYKTELKAKNEEISNTKINIKTCEDIIISYDKNIGTIRNQISHLQGISEPSDENDKTGMARYNNAQAEIGKLEGELEEAQQEKQKAEESKALLEETLKTLEEEKITLEENIKISTDKIDAAQSEIERLSSEQETNYAELADAIKKYEEQKAKEEEQEETLSDEEIDEIINNAKEYLNNQIEYTETFSSIPISESQLYILESKKAELEDKLLDEELNKFFETEGNIAVIEELSKQFADFLIENYNSEEMQTITSEENDFEYEIPINKMNAITMLMNLGYSEEEIKNMEKDSLTQKIQTYLIENKEQLNEYFKTYYDYNSFNAESLVTSYSNYIYSDLINSAAESSDTKPRTDYKDLKEQVDLYPKNIEVQEAWKDFVAASTTSWSDGNGYENYKEKLDALNEALRNAYMNQGSENKSFEAVIR